jgi:hypothetical protein
VEDNAVEFILKQRDSEGVPFASYHAQDILTLSQLSKAALKQFRMWQQRRICTQE